MRRLTCWFWIAVCFICFTVDAAQAQDELDPECSWGDQSSNTATLIGTGTISLNGAEIPDATILRAYTPSDLCRGVVEYTAGEQSYGLTIWGDDPFTEFEGFTNGDVITITAEIEGAEEFVDVTWTESASVPQLAPDPLGTYLTDSIHYLASGIILAPPPSGVTAQFSSAFYRSSPGPESIDVPIFIGISDEQQIPIMSFDVSTSSLTLSDIAVDPLVSDVFTGEQGSGETRIVLDAGEDQFLSSGVYEVTLTLTDPSGVIPDGLYEFSIIEGTVTYEEEGVFVSSGVEVSEDLGAAQLDIGELDVDITPLSVNFGETPAQNIATETINVTNNEDFVVEVTFNAPSTFGAPSNAQSVEPGASLTFDVTFEPTLLDFGDRSETMTVVVEDAQFNLELSGMGIHGAGDLTGSGTVTVGDPVMLRDAVLSVIELEPNEITAADIAGTPGMSFPNSDGQVDVADIAQLESVLAVGEYPGGLSFPAQTLPEAPNVLASSAQGDTGAQDVIVLSNEELLVKNDFDQDYRITLFEIETSNVNSRQEARQLISTHPSLPDDIDVTVGYRPDSQNVGVVVASNSNLPRSQELFSVNDPNARLISATAARPDYSIQPLSIVFEEEEAAGSFAASHPRPNPASEVVTINVRAFEDINLDITLFDILGRQVRQLDAQELTEGQERNVRIDISGIASGNYFIQIAGGDERITFRSTIIQ